MCISNDLTRIANFPIRIIDCDSHSPALLDLFFSSDASICSTVAFSLLRNSDHVVVWVSINSPSNSKQDVLFHCIAFDYSHADWDGLCDHWRDVQTPLGARLGLGTQPLYQPPCDLRVEIVQTQWLTSGEWGCPL